MLSHLCLLVCIWSALVAAQQPVWSQCGGNSWSGGTTCVAGSTCIKLNDYYYQCQPTQTTPASTTSIANSQVSTATATSSAASATGTQIRAVQDPVYHLYLQNSGNVFRNAGWLMSNGRITLVCAGGVPVLASESTAGRFFINGSITLISGSTKLYLNINTSTTSYKPLTFDTTASTVNWGLEGDTIITTNASPYGRQLNFLACTTLVTGNYRVYLQTGNDVPSGSTCSTITLHLPCLC